MGGSKYDSNMPTEGMTEYVWLVQTQLGDVAV
jgi:hypothetical protein